MKRSGWIFLSLLALCVAIAVIGPCIMPAANEKHSQEAILKEDLYSLRSAIDQYTQDKQRAPRSLDDLVSARYLPAIPTDPFTGSNTTWQTGQEDVLTPLDQVQPGITDVHSGSNKISSEGTPYSNW